MATKKLDSEWSGDILRNYWYDDTADTLHLENEQDIEPVLEHNKYQRDAWESMRMSGMGEFHKVASIPLVVVEQLMREGVWNDKVAFKKWLNKSDNTVFRTSTAVI